MLEFVHGKLVVESDTALLLYLLYDGLKRVNVFLVYWLHAKHHVTIHLNETTVAVISKTLVACLGCQSGNHGVVKTQVEDGVHHARHRCACSRANRHKQRILCIAKLAVHQVLDVCNRFCYLILKKGHYLVFAFLKIFVTGICGYCETRRNWHSNKVHLCKVGTFATKQVSHVGLSFSLAISKCVNSFFAHKNWLVYCVNLLFILLR